MKSDPNITLMGVETNNLKNLDIKIPLGQFTVVTGVSGSGKSSLVFDTLYSESYRRYVESLSSFARQFIKSLPKPKVKEVRNLQAAVAVKQHKSLSNQRSSVGTLTELSDFLQIIFFHLSRLDCPDCGREILKYTPHRILKLLESERVEEALMILAPLKGLAKNLGPKKLTNLLVEQGLVRIWFNGEILKIPEAKGVDLGKAYVITDRINVKWGESDNRLAEALKSAFRLGKGEVRVLGKSSQDFAGDMRCIPCDRRFPEPIQALFSFNHPRGACPSCQGYGRVAIDPYTRFRKYVLCTVCEGARFNKEVSLFRVNQLTIIEAMGLSMERLEVWTEQAARDGANLYDAQDQARAKLGEAFEELLSRVGYLKKVGLGYLAADRVSTTLSGGELQRIQMARCVGNRFTDTLICLDEPTRGLHPRDSQNLLSFIYELRDQGNTVVAVEHEQLVIRGADHFIEIGPGAGHKGGELVYAGPVPRALREAASVGKEIQTAPTKVLKDFIVLKNASTHNLKKVTVRFPLGAMTAVCGVSGSGKTSLIGHTLYPSLKEPGSHPKLHDVLHVSQEPIGRSSRSTIATYLGVYDEIRKLFASQKKAVDSGLSLSSFSFNVPGGRCEVCSGLGEVTEDLSFLGEMSVTCGECDGRRFQDKVLAVNYRSKNLLDILQMTVAQAWELFHDLPKIEKILKETMDLGLGYVNLGQSTSTFSGGEAQRLKLLKLLALAPTTQKPSLLIFDEPTTGLSDKDVALLVEQFRELTRKGHTVIIVEHHLGLIRSADWVVEMGPGAGVDGGELIYEGEPLSLRTAPRSTTGPFL